MRTSEKYLIGCVTVMTVAYLWLIRQYARELKVSESSGFVSINDDPEKWSSVPVFSDDEDDEPEDKPFIKGL